MATRTVISPTLDTVPTNVSTFRSLCSFNTRPTPSVTDTHAMQAAVSRGEQKYAAYTIGHR